MNKKFRTILFALLAVLFLITAPTAILYYMGWRFDWTTKTITQTGIFYFKISPRESRIHIDSEFNKKTGFFFNSALIENLTPRKYFVEIEKQGFHKWEKYLEIRKREVTEIKNVTLIPENPDFTIISKEIEDFYPFPDNKKIILKETYYVVNDSEGLENPEELILFDDNASRATQKWSLKLFDLENNLKSKLIDENDIITQIKKLDKNPLETKNTYKEINNSQIELIDLKFSGDSKKILIQVEQTNIETEKSELKYLTLEIDKAPDSLELILLPVEKENTKIENIYFSPNNFEEFLILLSCFSEDENETKELQVIDTTKLEIFSSVLSDMMYISVFEKDIYYIDQSGFIFKNNSSFNREEKLNFKPFYLKPESEYQVYERNFNIFLRENNVLYFLDRDKKVFEEFFEPVQNLIFSGDSKKMAYYNDFEARILFLEKIYDQPERDKYENIFLTRFSEEINDIFWYTDHYLLCFVGDALKIVEIDDRDKVNIVDLVKIEQLNLLQKTTNIEELQNEKIPDKEKPMLAKEAGVKIFWNENYKKLYVLSQNNLYSSEKLID